MPPTVTEEPGSQAEEHSGSPAQPMAPVIEEAPVPRFRRTVPRNPRRKLDATALDDSVTEELDGEEPEPLTSEEPTGSIPPDAPQDDDVTEALTRVIAVAVNLAALLSDVLLRRFSRRTLRAPDEGERTAIARPLARFTDRRVSTIRAVQNGLAADLVDAMELAGALTSYGASEPLRALLPEEILTAVPVAS